MSLVVPALNILVWAQKLAFSFLSTASVPFSRSVVSDSLTLLNGSQVYKIGERPISSLYMIIANEIII